MIHLFIGEDELAKQEKIQSLKSELFHSRDAEFFNCEVFYGRELTLPLFKEALSRIPVAVQRRLLVIKDALRLKESLQDYFLGQINNLPDDSILILDIAGIPREKNPLLDKLLKIARVTHFKTKKKTNAFDLALSIETKNAGAALNILADLFKAGEKPERILGALRYQFTKQGLNPEERVKRIDLLLAADLTIKTGKLKPEFALETLVVRLCLPR